MRSSELIGNTPWALIFTITLDNIWYARNNLIFHQHALTWEELTFKIPSICSQILESHSQERCFGHTTSRNMFHPPIWWFPPQPRAFKLNCDGSVLSSTEKQLVEECWGTIMVRWVYPLCIIWAFAIVYSLNYGQSIMVAPWPLLAVSGNSSLNPILLLWFSYSWVMVLLTTLAHRWFFEYWMLFVTKIRFGATH